jgi:glucan endo-1,3-beta-D-glucosidase
MHFAFCALLLGIGAVADPIRGFNYGGTAVNEPATEDDFVKAFTKAKNLPGTNSQFTSARLFSTIQSGTESDPVSAIPAAIKTQTRLLLTLWASAGQDAFQQELDALKKGLDQYGECPSSSMSNRSGVEASVSRPAVHRPH